MLFLRAQLFLLCLSILCLIWTEGCLYPPTQLTAARLQPELGNAFGQGFCTIKNCVSRKPINLNGHQVTLGLAREDARNKAQRNSSRQTCRAKKGRAVCCGSGSTRCTEHPGPLSWSWAERCPGKQGLHRGLTQGAEHIPHCILRPFTLIFGKQEAY